MRRRLLLAFVPFAFIPSPILAECSVAAGGNALTYSVAPIDQARPGCNLSCTVTKTTTGNGEEKTDVECTSTLVTAADARCKPSSSFIISNEKEPTKLACEDSKK